MGSATHIGSKIYDREMLHKKSMMHIEFAEKDVWKKVFDFRSMTSREVARNRWYRRSHEKKDVQKVKNGNHGMISGKITYTISNFLLKSMVTETSKNINGAEWLVWSQDYGNFDLQEKKKCGRSQVSENENRGRIQMTKMCCRNSGSLNDWTPCLS